ncbi:MAG TPA: T9SS type A sorting domain-containing protein [Bacteroidales bacterium]|nr:T9SS type A sorting domain-containing protein [Bacteroidales bacterium]
MIGVRTNDFQIMNHPAPSPDGSLLCVNLLMKGRQWFIAASILTILCINLLEPVAAQTWSDPVKINSSGSFSDVDFTVDKIGIIHCVFIRNTNIYDYRNLYYSASKDHGETWSVPVQLTKFSEKNIDDPHIVADTNGNLFLSYDYDVDHYPNLKIGYQKFTVRDSAWSLPEFIATGMSNRLVIDHNNRVYFFWFTGTEHYKYLEGAAFSDSLTPYPSLPVFFDDITVDHENNLHCIGNRKAGAISHGAYFKCRQESWLPFNDLCKTTSFYEGRISLDQVEIPSFTWVRYMKDSLRGFKGLFYARWEGDTISEPVFFGYKADSPDLAFDVKDDPHIVQTFEDTILYHYFLVHQHLTPDGWKTDTLEYNHNRYGEVVLKTFKNSLYLAYPKADTTWLIPSFKYYVNIFFRKMEFAQGMPTIDNKPSVYCFPNPSHDRIVVNIPPGLSDKISVKIFDASGNLCYERHNLVVLPNTREFTIDFNENATRLSAGSYIIHITDGSHSFSTKIIRDQ